MPYLTDGQKVAGYLGVDLTGLQLTQVDRLLPAADAFITRYCGRSFGLATALTGERHTVMGGLVFLLNRPVASVQAVRVRSWGIGATTEALVAASSYELVDGNAGILAVSCNAVGQLLEVDYTPGQTTPGDVTLAATMLVAHWLRPHLVEDGITPDVKRYTVGQDLTVEYRDDAASGVAPVAVTALLATYRVAVFA